MTRLYFLLLPALLLVACQRDDKTLAGQNGVYYWRTTLRLDSAERAFLHQHHIRKVYCRYFDVVMGEEGEPVPNATLAFSDTLPGDIEVVPTVYITEDCMHKAHPHLAEKLVKRILQMNETNDIADVREIQIDCDYTVRSRDTYYNFLKEVRSQLSIIHSFSRRSAFVKSAKPSGQLSITIRLHQLAMPAPPVDYGVLMIYNTGDPNKFMERNPILDLRDVVPYVKYLDDYSLPLGTAYPVYQWQRQIHGVRIEHSVEADEILRVKQAVERARPDLSRTIVTYCLDKENIQRYNSETYEEIYRH